MNNDHGQTRHRIASLDYGKLLPVTLNQEKRLLIEEVQRSKGKTSRPFNILSVLSLSGNLRAKTLERSLNEIIQRHSMLRAHFVPTPEIAESERQDRRRVYCTTKLLIPGLFGHSIATCGDVKLMTHSLEGRCAIDQSAALQQIVDELGQSGITGIPKISACLIRLTLTRHILVIVVPHLVCDGHSMQIIKREIAQLYPALLSGRQSSLPQVAHHFSEFAAFQHRYLASAAAAPASEYWAQQWAKYESSRLQCADLQVGESTSGQELAQSKQVAHIIDKGTADQLRVFARKSNATLFMLLFATLCVAILGFSGKRQIALWSNFANRVPPEFQVVVGWFVQSHLLGLDLAEEPDLTSLLAQARATVLNATIYQGFPTSHLWRTLGKAPAPEGAFVLLDFTSWEEVNTITTPPIAITQLPLSSFVVSSAISKTLHISIVSKANEVEVVALFNDAILSRADITTLFRRWFDVTSAWVTNPLLRAFHFSKGTIP
jgi:hypothetical protein